MAKVRKDDEISVLLGALSVVVAVHELMSTWDLPHDLKGYFSFIATNAARLNKERDDIDNLPSDTQDESRWKQRMLRGNVWTQSRHSVYWSIDRVTDLTAQIVWRAMVVGRTVNRMRKAHGLKTVDFYEAAKEIDKESNDGPATEIRPNQALYEDQGSAVRNQGPGEAAGSGADLRDTWNDDYEDEGGEVESP